MSLYIPGEKQIDIPGNMKNGTAALYFHAMHADDNAVRLISGVNWSCAQWFYAKKFAVDAVENSYCSTVLLPGQKGWEVRASLLQVNYTLMGENDNEYKYPPEFVVNLLDTTDTPLNSTPVQVAVMESQDWGKWGFGLSIMLNPEAAMWSSGGIATNQLPSLIPAPGALWTAASKVPRKVQICVSAKNVHALHVVGIPIWDHQTLIQSMA